MYELNSLFYELLEIKKSVLFFLIDIELQFQTNLHLIRYRGISNKFLHRF